MDDVDAQMDPKRVRIGLIIIAVIFLASIVLLFVAKGPFPRAIFFGIAVVCLVRMYLLVRWVRRRDVTPPTA